MLNNNNLNTHKMKTFKIEQKRAGQDWNDFGAIHADNFIEATKKFAAICKADLLNGVHGDDFIYEDEETIKEIEGDTSWFDVPGVYYERELFLSDEDVENGIETFSEDVYSYRVLEN